MTELHHWVCVNPECICFGDTTPAQYGKCFICDTEQEAFTTNGYISFLKYQLSAAKKELRK